ncbi:MAG: D-arabinose 5-phosphate isomerase, partial [Flavisolibacter sp.]|nr:D-arabinose 5-phosphate isomerase [Flavisolibacter sp.]
MKKTTSILGAALRTIKMEADAVHQLAEQLDEAFEETIHILAACKGR